jgi:hypothetical protein
MYIEDGVGSGRKAEVTEDHLLRTLACTLAYNHYINHEFHTAYSIVFNVTPNTDNARIFYLKNLDDSDLDLTSMEFYSDSTQALQICTNCVGTPGGGSNITPVNRMAGTADTASVLAQCGNLTGLTGGNMVDRVFTTGMNGSIKRTWESGIIIPKNTVLTLSTLYADVEIWITLSILFHNND